MVVIQTLSSFQLESRPGEFLHDHLKAVGDTTQQIFENLKGKIDIIFSDDDLQSVLYYVGATHDIGKGTKYFQEYLYKKESKETNFQLLKSHSFVSSLYCSWIIENSNITKEVKDFLQIAAVLAIQGHHGSLKQPSEFAIRLNNFRKKEIFKRQIDSFAVDELEQISKSLKLPSFKEFVKNWETAYDNLIRKILQTDNFLKEFTVENEPYFVINLLFSVLLDADRMNAAGIQTERTEIDTDAVVKFTSTIPKFTGRVFEQRKALFENCSAKSNQVSLEQKIFTLSAATGLGKTLSSLNFSLNLRKRIEEEKGHKPRIIYVAPFISILDQSAKTFSKIFGEDSQTNRLLVHHHLSQVEYTKKSEDEQNNETYSTSKAELLLQGWNSEIVVTTFIQFFDSIFGRYTSNLRRLHNISGSIIILDEVQSLPVEYWEAVRQALLFLCNHFDFKIILMTATQPLIFESGEFEEICRKEFSNVPDRVTFRRNTEDPITIAEFRERMNELISENPQKSILIELNTVATAISVFDSLDGNLNRHFLSSQIIPLHRKPRIDDIKRDLKEKKPTVVVSTQVIEAGVDLDFDMAVRDIGPIDSIVQTAGRCNREGKNKVADSSFFVYRIVDGDNHEFAIRVYGRVAIDIARDLLQRQQTIPNLVGNYYEEISNRGRGATSNDINQGIAELDYETVNDTFRLIDQDYSEPVFVEINADAAEIWQEFLKLSDPTKKVPREKIIKIRKAMEQYMIGVSDRDIARNHLQEQEGVYYLAQNQVGMLYNMITGFRREPPR